VSGAPPWVDVDGLSMAAAIDAVERALAGGLDPDADGPRVRTEAGEAGHFLLMDAAHGGYAGVKVTSVAAGNPARGLPRIQGVYVLFDGDTLTPIAMMDGAAITALRTPAVSAMAARHLAAPDARRLLVFGTGPQAARHLEALRVVLPPLDRVEVAGRDRSRAARFAADHDAVVAGNVEEVVRGADVICCCTSAAEPLFDGALVRDDATVIAVGSHEPHVRELDSTLMRRSAVVVESRATALREAGDVIQAVEDDALDPAALIMVGDLVRGRARDALATTRPRVFKSAGMSWEDVVVAGAAWEKPAGASG
jgi:ornithine cyclodeaminase